MIGGWRVIDQTLDRRLGEGRLSTGARRARRGAEGLAEALAVLMVRRETEGLAAHGGGAGIGAGSRGCNVGSIGIVCNRVNRAIRHDEEVARDELYDTDGYVGDGI